MLAIRATNERLRHKCHNRPDDFPVDLFSLQLDELKLLQDEAPETKSQVPDVCDLDKSSRRFFQPVLLVLNVLFLLSY